MRINQAPPKIQIQKAEKGGIVVNIKEPNQLITYGVVLYLNGQRVHGKKTMRHFGWFQGFKKGNGMFSQFLFSTPELASEIPEDN